MTDEEGARLLAMLTDIGIIDQLASTAANRALAPVMTLTDYSLLNHMVRRGDGETPSRLAAAFQVAKPSMTATVTKLAARGLVAVRGNPDDARSKRVFLTAAGRRAHGEGQRQLAAMLPRALAGFDVAALLDHAPALAALRAHLDTARNVQDGFA